MAADSYEDQIKFYAKNSLDRFGDDLCALLLSYLSLEDRFRLECVSKQFQRTVFASVVDIDMNDTFIDKIIGEISDKKCMKYWFAMNVIKTESIPRVLQTLLDKCMNLRDIYCNLWSNSDQWIQSFAPLITRVNIFSSTEKLSLIYSHRLSQLSVWSLSDVFDTTSRQLLAQNLQKFEFRYKSSDNKGLLSAFVAHNQSLKSVCINCNPYVNFNEMSQQLSRLTQLRELTLSLRLMYGQNSLSESLLMIGLNCKQLQRLSLQLMSNNTPLNGETLDSLRCYHRLKRLDLTLIMPKNEEVLEPLKLCHQLTHLTLDFMDYNNYFLINKFMDNCGKHWPRVQYLFININAITGECLSHISRLPVLQMLDIQCNLTTDLSDNDLNAVLSSSPKLKTIEIRVNNEKKFYSKEKCFLV